MQNVVAWSTNSWCDFRLLERQQTYNYCLWMQSLKNVMIIKASANHNSFWTYSLGARWKQKTFTQQPERVFVTRGSTAHENSNRSDPCDNVWCDQTMRSGRANFRNAEWSADSSCSSFETNPFEHVKKKKSQPAPQFVVSNIPPERYEFPNLAMRAILEWTPGREWRQ